jgi:hypothetical protein
MLRKISVAALGIVMLLSLSAAADDKPWFDMENCDFCKHLTSIPGMMEAITWENINTKTGLLSLTTIPDNLRADYMKAHEAMEETGKKWEAGETVNTCGMCDGIGELMMAGLEWDFVETTSGYASIWIGKDEASIGKIHAWADRTNDEMKKMMEHEGHNH